MSILVSVDGSIRSPAPSIASTNVDDSAAESPMPSGSRIASPLSCQQLDGGSTRQSSPLSETRETSPDRMDSRPTSIDGSFPSSPSPSSPPLSEPFDRLDRSEALDARPIRLSTFEHALKDPSNGSFGPGIPRMIGRSCFHVYPPSDLLSISF